MPKIATGRFQYKISMDEETQLKFLGQAARAGLGIADYFQVLVRQAERAENGEYYDREELPKAFGFARKL